MTQNDTYYRALSAYRAIVDSKRECVRDRCSLADANGNENIKIKRVNCTIDNTWIEEIETGLTFIEKAIKEDRQFIYSNGEVIPIEKVKNVSKESVEHLARHSDLITRKQDGKDLVPDKLYTVERISDYTIYENKFLYMLLCYLRDFVSLRYTKILDLTNCYNGTISVEKDVAVFKRKLKLSLALSDERKDDDYLKAHNPAGELIDRMDLILKAITALLNTPLMECVSKVAMLKPPITKTNILKMDNNFKGAMALYEFIISYTGEGFTLEEKITEIEPFKDTLSADVAEIGQLISFVTYQYGLGLTDDLKTVYELEEANRRTNELKQKTEQIEAIRRRLDRNEISPLEYIYELENHVRALQNEVDRASSLYEKVDGLKSAERRLLTEIDMLTEKCTELEGSIELIKNSYEEKIKELQILHRQEIAELTDKHNAELSLLQARHAEQLANINERHTEEVKKLKDSLSESRTEAVCLCNENSTLSEENKLLQARVWALRSYTGDISNEEKEQLTSQEDFDRLESELDAFIRFYKEQWGKTKRKIRKDLINMKYIKGKNSAQ